MTNLGEAVKKHQDGAILNIFITPNCQSNIFPSGFDEWRKKILVQVYSPPKKNKANVDIIKICATYFNIPIRNVIILSGKTSREKSILIMGISANNAIKKLRMSLDGL